MLCDRIHTLRRRAGLSQDQLAERLGVSRQAVSRWENGSAVPGLEKLQAMCRCFQVSMDQLTGAEEIPPLPPVLPPEEKLSRRSRLGAALCAGGGMGVLCLGAAMLLRPASLEAVDASSAVTLNGSGVLLLLLLLTMGAGAILVLRDRGK